MKKGNMGWQSKEVWNRMCDLGFRTLQAAEPFYSVTNGAIKKR